MANDNRKDDDKTKDFEWNEIVCSSEFGCKEPDEFSAVPTSEEEDT